MKHEEALKLLSKIEAYRKTPAMHEAEHDITCRIIAAMVAEAGGFKSRNEWTAALKEENTMKIINTANNKVLANIITNHRMSIEEALEAVGIDLSTCDDEGAYRDNDGEQFWIEDCEEADED